MTRARRRIEFHPLSMLFPLIEGEAFDEIVADIKAHGLHEPIVRYEGRILDGRNRYNACIAAGIEPEFVDYTGADPVAYVVSLNLKRRHLNESQRAMVAAKLATLKRGDNQHSPVGETSQARAAELLNVGKRSVERAADVRDHGAPELQHAVERGDVSVSAAADVATMPQADQREIVARGEREILRAASEIRARRTEVRRAERIQRLAEISRGNEALDLPGRYPVLYVDPPWRHDTSIDDSRRMDNDFPTMSLEEICALPVAGLATADAILFVWATNPLLKQAIAAIDAWGFTYQSNVAWDKEVIGLGWWLRSQHELLLIATRGDMPHPPAHARPPSVIRERRREPHRKPDKAYELIERMYPELPKVELFLRGKPRPRWSGAEAGGNEVEASTAKTEPPRRMTIAELEALAPHEK
jgi:N6-adenosine-specific RNA methylase IME4/ParB-like chromosome segregation protein Spo0J